MPKKKLSAQDELEFRETIPNQFNIRFYLWAFAKQIIHSRCWAGFCVHLFARFRLRNSITFDYRFPDCGKVFYANCDFQEETRQIPAFLIAKRTRGEMHFDLRKLLKAF